MIARQVTCDFCRLDLVKMPLIYTTTQSSGISLNISYNIIHDNGLEMQGKLCFQQKGLTWTAEGCYNLINDEKGDC